MRLWLLAFLLLPFTAQADVVDDYMQARANYMLAADSCDLINAREILQLNTMPVAELKTLDFSLEELFTETRDNRKACYEAAADKLADMVSAALIWVEKKPDDLSAVRQLEIDQDLSEMLRIRREISQKLLRSMEADIQATLKKTPSRKAAETFVEESVTTRNLIQQDMNIVLEAERRQIAAEEAALNAIAKPDMADAARVKLMKATHYFSRALLVFESALQEPRHYHLARLMSEFAYGSNQFAELFGLHPTLKGLEENLARQIAHVADRALVMQLDLEGAVRELRANDFRDDYEQWLSEIYQDMSSLAVEIRTLYHHLPKTPPLAGRAAPSSPRPSKTSTKVKKKAAQTASAPVRTSDGKIVPLDQAPSRLLVPTN